MVKVITYGTYDVLHYGHIRLLERAKALGDYLIVGVTADDFDKTRGKINVQQSLMERVEAVRATGIADEIIIEEYEGQKIDDIRKYDVDIFTVGSDWVGYFDYLNEYCKVVYLERTQGVSSTEIRAEKRSLRLGLVGNYGYLNKFYKESKYVNGIKVVGICTDNDSLVHETAKELEIVTSDYNELINQVDAVFIHSTPSEHYKQVKQALFADKHVMCESPVALSYDELLELETIAKDNNLILMDSLRTAYSTAFNRMILALKAGKIGDIVSVDATCTSLNYFNDSHFDSKWNSISAWGPTSLLPIFSLLGTEYTDIKITSKFKDRDNLEDLFTKIDISFPNAVATVKVGHGVKSESVLTVSGTQGCAIVPSPWWKTDYYEFRYENAENNKRFFYQLDGEGIRNELVVFARSIANGKIIPNITEETSCAITRVMEEFYYKHNFKEI